VVPTIRKECIEEFLGAWRAEFLGQRVVVVEDNPKKSFSLPSWVEHYSWEEINGELGKDAWIIPRRSDTVRSFGYFKAWQGKPDYILTLDDDCLPEKDYGERGFLGKLEENLAKKWPDDSWWNTLSDEVCPRGYPYGVREVKRETVMHHGLWSNVPDLDARTQKKRGDYRTSPARKLELVPRGRFFPMCGMNLAFKPKVVPMLYFMLMGKDWTGKPWPYDRFGDIWAGVFAKKICDHLGWAVTSGAPSVHHAKASDVEVNWEKEKPGVPVNEMLWQRVERVCLSEKSVGRCYLQLAEQLDMEGEYWGTLKQAMRIWVGLFEKC